MQSGTGWKRRQTRTKGERSEINWWLTPGRSGRLCRESGGAEGELMMSNKKNKTQLSMREKIKGGKKKGKAGARAGREQEERGVEARVERHPVQRSRSEDCAVTK